MAETVRVKGLNELVRAFGKMDKELRKDLQRELSKAALIVRGEAASGFMHISPRSAGGFRPRVRGSTAVVEQRYRKVTGLRGDYGAHQMWYLLRALRDKEDEVVGSIDIMLGKLGGENGF
jgi:hypothetical protein